MATVNDVADAGVTDVMNAIDVMNGMNDVRSIAT